jgi:hypothetical protein
MEPPRRYSPAELRIIAFLAKIKGRLLTFEEINLALAQARAMGTTRLARKKPGAGRRCHLPAG